MNAAKGSSNSYAIKSVDIPLAPVLASTWWGLLTDVSLPMQCPSHPTISVIRIRQLKCPRLNPPPKPLYRIQQEEGRARACCQEQPIIVLYLDVSAHVVADSILRCGLRARKRGCAQEGQSGTTILRAPPRTNSTNTVSRLSPASRILGTRMQSHSHQAACRSAVIFNVESFEASAVCFARSSATSCARTVVSKLPITPWLALSESTCFQVCLPAFPLFLSSFLSFHTLTTQHREMTCLEQMPAVKGSSSCIDRNRAPSSPA